MNKQLLIVSCHVITNYKYDILKVIILMSYDVILQIYTIFF